MVTGVWICIQSRSSDGKPTLIAEETLPSVGAQARRLERRLGDAGGAARARVPLAGGELAQLAGVEGGTHAEPVLRVATRREAK